MALAANKRREAILAATVRLFSIQGYPQTSIRDIAREVGLLPGSLYAHIDSKEALLYEIVRGGIERFLVESRAAASSQTSADERMRAVIRSYVEVSGEDTEQALVALHQWRYLTGDQLVEVKAMRREFEGIFRSIFDEGVTEGAFDATLNPHVAVLTIIGAVNWTTEWFSPKGPNSPDEIGDQIANTVLSGLLTRPGPG